MSLFGVLYVVTYLGRRCFGVAYLSGHFCVLLWCFINMTILFGVIAIFGKLLFGNNHIIDIIVSMTFLFDVIAISPYLNCPLGVEVWVDFPTGKWLYLSIDSGGYK